ncbi:MAG: CHASE2 domain-containing protein [Cyanobacteria bacterium J06648_1]
MTNHRYQLGGSLDIEDANYVVREADSQLYRALKEGEFCYVLSSRQMGKSSLLVRTKYHLENCGFCCAALDLTGIGSDNITPEQWYKGLISQLYLGFNLVGKLKLKEWWLSHQDISLIQKLNAFIVDVLLVEYSDRKLVIFIDEIDSIFGLPFSTDDFFTFIRFCYNQRAIFPVYRRINFAVFGVATPSSLIENSNRTPFNIGKSIQLDGFSFVQSRHLLETPYLSSGDRRLALQEILLWTRGQPFLTQKLCHLLSEYLDTSEYHDRAIEQIVEQNIISNWRSQDEPEHLRTISDRILNSDITSVRILEIYRQILLCDFIPRNNSIEHSELLLSGIVIDKQGNLVAKNPIYQKVFNLRWVENRLNELRPYSSQLDRWIDSKQQDESQLLQGIYLQQALNWANGKKLSELDYQFLGAAQELARYQVEEKLNTEKNTRQKIEIALEASATAVSILSEVRKKAKRKVTKLKLSKTWLSAIVFIATILVILLRDFGSFQAWELSTFDLFMRSRPINTVENKITIIGINERDIQAIKSYPISDRILANAINKIKSDRPTGIGIDIYRDLPVPPGTSELKKAFLNTDNLWGIEKVVGSQVNPAQELARSGRVGFSDLVLDRDGKVRRALLAYDTGNDEIGYSFSLQLALQYLTQWNIKPQPTPNTNQIELGKANFVPLESNSGNYVDAKTKGYQILLNYHGIQSQFTTYSLQDLLTNKVPRSAIKNRLVIIGVTASSVNDFFATPYSSQKLIPGIYIHANAISQILAAALHNEGLFQVLPDRNEWLWILLWSLVGVALSAIATSHFKTLLSIIISLTLLSLTAYLSFLLGWWLPLITPAIAIVFAVSLARLITLKQREKIELEEIVRLLLKIAKYKPAAGKIAIEYLKQGENKENKNRIDDLVDKSCS